MGEVTRHRWLALLGLVFVVGACGEGGGGEGGQGVVPQPDGLLIDPVHQTLELAPGGTRPLHVKLARTGTLSGAILVTVSAGPAGVSASSLVLSAEETEGDLLLRAEDFAEVGAKGRLLVLAQSGREAYSASVDVFRHLTRPDGLT